MIMLSVDNGSGYAHRLYCSYNTGDDDYTGRKIDDSDDSNYVATNESHMGNDV
jgi:hypothetical protein